MTGTVKFDVGGRNFKISRALVDEHSDSVLGKLVSQTWNDDPNKEVFIDRSGDLFAQVLEYLRYGSIELPMTIPRSMFERELDYYGIISSEDTINDQGGGLADIMGSFAQPVIKAKKNLAEAETQRNMFSLAHDCYNQFCKMRLVDPNANKVMVQVNKDIDSRDRNIFDEFLEIYFGLAVRMTEAYMQMRMRDVEFESVGEDDYLERSIEKCRNFFVEVVKNNEPTTRITK